MYTLISVLSLGLIVGTAMQLHQLVLWPLCFYGLVSVLGCVLFWSNQALSVFGIFLFSNFRRRYFLFFTSSLALAFAQTGWRAHHYLENRLNPELEGRSIQLEGVVASLPQRTDDSVRFRLEVQPSNATPNATLNANANADAQVASAALPRFLWLGWYGGRTWGQGAAAQADPPPDVKGCGSKRRMGTSTRTGLTMSCGCGSRVCRPRVMCVMGLRMWRLSG
jgi:hypothetical protein